jgi:hypothetical protein
MLMLYKDYFLSENQLIKIKYLKRIRFLNQTSKKTLK